jgi:hypothetical protein
MANCFTSSVSSQDLSFGAGGALLLIADRLSFPIFASTGPIGSQVLSSGIIHGSQLPFGFCLVLLVSSAFSVLNQIGSKALPLPASDNFA